MGKTTPGPRGSPTHLRSPALQRKGEDEEEEEKERGGVGELDIKIDWGMVADFWSLQQRVSLSGSSSRGKRAPAMTAAC